MSEICTVIGPYRQGEIPPPLIVTFRDEIGTVIDLSGYAGRFEVERPDGTLAAPTATILPQSGSSRGQWEYAWVDGDLALRGDYRGEAWVGNGTNRYASVRLVWSVDAAIAVPAI